MTDDELRAAERLRRIAKGEPIVNVYADLAEMPDHIVDVWLTDRARLTDVALRLTDPGEPITPELLRERYGWKEEKTHERWRYYVSQINQFGYRLTVCFRTKEDDQQWRHDGTIIPTPAGTRDLESLMTHLGIPWEAKT